MHVSVYSNIWCLCNLFSFTSIPVSELFSVLDEEVGFLNSSNQEKSVWMLYSNGKRDSYNCHMTPKLCDLIAEFVSAAKCRRGEVSINMVGMDWWSDELEEWTNKWA